MGVYIKGIEKKPCAECMFRGYDYCLLTDEYIGVDAEYKPEECPLIEVKAPHGDLIDRSELFKWYEGQRTKYPIKKETPQYETMMMYEVFDEIDDAEAVIEAEEE